MTGLTIHPWAAGLHLSFPRIVKKFLREWRIAPTQLWPQWLEDYDRFSHSVGPARLIPSLVREFNSLYSFKLDRKRSGWWYAPVKAKTGGSVVTQTLDSVKNWKKFWFFVRGSWQFFENDTRLDVNIPVVRYSSYDPTEESSERVRRARTLSEHY
ncbi:Uncharacterized protein Adt_12556 [Abeliophyllum distichum]|uniref:Uncharacterized protein n=1 Tax=Abeliophyllum distichum TaxID=126358 RepID=A0ABD1UR26_9LAMI